MIFVLAVAHATPPGDMAHGFVSEPRDDAPTDARILFDANFALPAEVTDGPAAPEQLVADMLFLPWYDARVAFSPPAAGWVAGEAYTVTASWTDYGEPTEAFELSFTAGSGPAADPIAPEILSVDVGEWSDEEQHYSSGCCRPVRSVTVRFRSDDPDPWAFVEARGGRGREDRIELAVGPGEHEVVLEQSKDGLRIEPEELFLVGVAADGDVSAEVAIDVDDEGGGGIGGCSTTGGAWTLALSLLAARRRQGRKM